MDSITPVNPPKVNNKIKELTHYCSQYCAKKHYNNNYPNQTIPQRQNKQIDTKDTPTKIIMGIVFSDSNNQRINIASQHNSSNE